MQQRKLFWLLFSLLLPIFISESANAIIIRHDRQDAKYVKLAKPYAKMICQMNLEAPGKAPDGVGTLIFPNWVLTAAHVGADVKVGHLVTVAGENYEVEKVFLHPDYEDGGRHDIALLKLKTTVKGVKRAELFRERNEVGQIITVVGKGDWGTGLTGPTTNDRKLRGAMNKVDEASEAWLKFVFDNPEKSPNKALDLEGISGPGDSGGPAFIKKNGKIFLIGVGSGQSTSATGGREGVYGVTEYYVRVSSYLGWIEKVIRENERG